MQITIDFLRNQIAKKHLFGRRLLYTGCTRDAARKLGRHGELDPLFSGRVTISLYIAAGDL